jgi:hypothetical protein
MIGDADANPDLWLVHPTEKSLRVRPSFMRTATVILSGLALFILASCTNGARPTPTQTPQAAPAVTVAFRIYAAPTATPMTVEQARQIVQNNPSFLASQHLALGLSCESCHHPFPPTTGPSNSTCLACHGGSYDAVAALTPGAMNPHHSHLGALPCGFCHYGHQPFESQCSQCKHAAANP